MRKAIFVLIIALIAGCGSGSDDFSFEGTWTGRLTLIGNDCPFIVPLQQDQVFPVVISSLPNGNLLVNTADGKVGEGIASSANGESFVITREPFGNVDDGDIDCEVQRSFGFFSGYDDSAQAELTLSYENCTGPAGNTLFCGITYSGDTSKIN